MRKLIGLVTLVMLLGVLASPAFANGNGNAIENGTEHCPDHETSSKVEGGNLNDIVLPAGTEFCVKGSTDATGKLTADGEKTLVDYLDNGHDVSYYVVYSQPTPPKVNLTSACYVEEAGTYEVYVGGSQQWVEVEIENDNTAVFRVANGALVNFSVVLGGPELQSRESVGGNQVLIFVPAAQPGTVKIQGSWGSVTKAQNTELCKVPPPPPPVETDLTIGGSCAVDGEVYFRIEGDLGEGLTLNVAGEVISEAGVFSIDVDEAGTYEYTVEVAEGFTFEGDLEGEVVIEDCTPPVTTPTTVPETTTTTQPEPPVTTPTTQPEPPVTTTQPAPSTTSDTLPFTGPEDTALVWIGAMSMLAGIVGIAASKRGWMSN